MYCLPERSAPAYHIGSAKAKGIYFIISAIIVLAHVHSTSAQSTGGSLVSYPNSQVEFIIGPHVRVGTDPLASYYDDAAVRRGRYWAEQFLNSPLYASSNHYDLPLCLYILYYRTGDLAFLDYARRVADKWWKGPHVRQGLPVTGGDIPGPMYTGVLGLTLYALDGHPEVFGYLDRITREWVNIKFLSRLNALEIYTDLREEGYALLSAVALAKALPDQFSQTVWDNNFNISTTQVTDGAARRARYLADSELVAVQYFGRLQQPDGGWRWNLWVPPYTRNLEQPFMLGIYLESVVRLHQITTNQSVKDSLASQLKRACEHLYRDTYVHDVVPGLTSIPRVTLYFWPLALNSQDYQASDRHLTTSQLHAFGYAYKITGDPKYITWGDEMWDSCYRAGDGYNALIDVPNYLKLFTMEARSAGSYLAWRQGAQLPSPTPTPFPTPTPDPNPLPTPTPAPTPQPTPLPTPTPTPTQTGASILSAKRDGQILSNQLASSGGASAMSSVKIEELSAPETEALQRFIAEIQTADLYFDAERDVFPAAARIQVELNAALQRALQSQASSSQGDLTGVKAHLRAAITHLELAGVLIAFPNIANPIDSASYVVRQHYLDFLDREPDQAGSDYWVNQLNSCGGNAQCAEYRRINVSAAFFLSMEFQETGYFVYRIYKASYRRVPTRAEFMPDNAVIGQGVIVGTAGWEDRLAANKDQFLQNWVQRTGFASRYASMGNAQYVDTIIFNIGVTVSPAERNSLILDLANGASRASVLGRLADNQLFSTKEFNTAFVLMQYFGYLRRDFDNGGFTFWLNKLNQFGGNYQSAEMVKAFLSSQEYRRRFQL